MTFTELELVLLVANAALTVMYYLSQKELKAVKFAGYMSMRLVAEKKLTPFIDNEGDLCMKPHKE